MTDESRSPAGVRPARWLAVVLFGLIALEVVGASVVGLASGQSLSQAVESFAATNLAIALSFGACGALLAWHRPSHPTGWLLAGSGFAQGATGVAAVLLLGGDLASVSPQAVAAAATVFSWGWPWSMGLGFLFALLLFPDGKLPSPRWRPVALSLALTGLAFVVSTGGDPASSTIDGRSFVHWGAIPGYSRLGPLWSVVGLLNVAGFLAVLGSLVVRYRRGGEDTRRQLLWLVLAVLAVVLIALPGVVLHTGSVLFLLVIVLVPAAIVIAVLRHNLLDIRLVVSRTVSWAVLSAAVGAAYLVLVSVLGAVLAGTASAVVATATVAMAVNPVRRRLQRRVDRLFYGDRGDPLRVFGRVGAELGGRDDLTALATAIADSMRLPFVAIRTGGRELVSSGEASSVIHTVPLMHGTERLGELLVGARRGDRRLTGADKEMLELVAAPVAMAVHATLLAEELQAARARIVTAREEERRRLRRDLHDGLGPVLTGIGFKADAARNYVHGHPKEAVELLGQLRLETTSALEDVRRLVYDLRPPVLDDHGLVEALRRQAQRLDRRGDGSPLDVRIDAPAELPPLPAAVEVAAYRIATEALVNVVRHSQAATAVVSLRVDDCLHLRVLDDGGPATHAWIPGVGLASMRERVAELGGSITAKPGLTGTEVSARLPIEPLNVHTEGFEPQKAADVGSGS